MIVIVLADRPPSPVKLCSSSGSSSEPNPLFCVFQPPG
jgi:hypothetical protein